MVHFDKVAAKMSIFCIFTILSLPIIVVCIQKTKLCKVPGCSIRIKIIPENWIQQEYLKIISTFERCNYQ